MKTTYTEALIVGTGFGGAAPALRLAEAGIKTLVLEKGPDIVPERDFRITQDPAYLTRYIKSLKGDHLSLNYVEGLGGGSGFYEMVSLRTPSLAFNQKGPGGKHLWPAGLSRAVLNPYYETAEKMLSVRQISHEAVPKTGLVFSLLMKKLGYSVDRAPFAEKNCINSGFCVTGCVFNAKQSLHKNYLPRAKKAGATFLCNTEAHSIQPMDDIPGISRTASLEAMPYRYQVICNSNGKECIIRTKFLVLAAGTIGTAALLLKSRKSLPALSRQAGRNISFNGSVKAAGILPDWCPDGDMYTGRSIPGMVSFEFLNSHGLTIMPAKPLPLQVIAAARLTVRGNQDPHAYWGKSHVDLMQLYRHRVLLLAGIGLGAPTGSIKLNKSGNPTLNLELSHALRAYYKRNLSVLESILSDSGCTLLDIQPVDRTGIPYKDVHFFSSHQLGSCRMADSPDMGVTDHNGEVFHYPDLYISDGAVIPTALAVNPSLTILANAERIAEGIVSKYTGAERQFMVKSEIESQ